MLYTAGAAFLSITTSLLLFWKLEIIPISGKAIKTANNAVQVIRHESLHDDEKEKAVQHAAIALLILFISILSRSLVVLAGSLLPIWVADRIGLTSMETVLGLLSW